MISAVVSLRCFLALGDSLRSHFDNICVLQPDPVLAPWVADHPDMILASIGGKLIVPANYYGMNFAVLDPIAEVAGLDIITSDVPRGTKYPHDIPFNALITDRHIFAKLSHIAPELLKIAGNTGLTPIGVNQGYAACSAVSVKNVIVTGDPSIKTAAEKHGYDIIKIDSSGIKLDGYDHGFIGGASAVIGNTVYFIGDPQKTPGTQTLISELEARGIKYEILFDGPLTDYGGIKLFNF